MYINMWTVSLMTLLELQELDHPLFGTFVSIRLVLCTYGYRKCSQLFIILASFDLWENKIMQSLFLTLCFHYCKAVYCSHCLILWYFNIPFRQENNFCKWSWGIPLDLTYVYFLKRKKKACVKVVWRHGIPHLQN